MSIRILHALARVHGLQPTYTDGTGVRRGAPPEAIVAVLRAMRVDIESASDAPRLLREHRLRSPPLCGPVAVAWDAPAAGGRPRSVEIHIDAAQASADATLRVTLADGSALEHSAPAFEIAPTSRAGIARARVALPASVPHGRHAIEIEHAGRRGESVLLAAPDRCWSPPGAERTLGLFLPAYAARSADDWGAGGVGELDALLGLARDTGSGWVGTLPLLAQFYDTPDARRPGVPFDRSPYAPVSRRFWNERLADPARAPELDRCAEARDLLASRAFRERRARLGGLDLVDDAGAWRLKRDALAALARCAYAGDRGADRRARLERQRPDLAAYAAFRASWLTGADAAARRAEHELFLYAQELVSTQLGSLAAEGERDGGPRLYLDLPIGTHPEGFDARSSPSEFAEGVTMGAPPDGLFAGGQDWSIVPTHPIGSRERGHADFAASVRAHLRIAGALRIDHVMWMHRAFWIPRGMPAAAGVYVRHPTDELYAILAIESHRARGRVVGEDLGTVPDEVRTTMNRRGVLGLSVGLFELGSDDGTGSDPADAHPAAVLPDPGPGRVACLDTHDTATMPGLLSGADAELRARLGLIDAETMQRQQREAARLRDRLARALAGLGLLDGPGPYGGTGPTSVDVDRIVAGLLRHLARSSSPAVLVNLEDLLGATLPQNTPGLSDEHPSWRRRTAQTVAELASDRRIAGVLRELSALRRGETVPGPTDSRPGLPEAR